MFFLYDHLLPGTFVNCYADTDSMAIATTRTKTMIEGMSPEEELRAVFDPIVKPDMRDSWEANWKKWFVTTDTVEDERFPGKLKRKQILTIPKFKNISGEFQFLKGRFIALGPKTYYSINLESMDVKMGSKGIPHNENLLLEDFLKMLYSNDSHFVTLRSLRLNRNREMARTTLEKRGLSNIFFKFRLEDDGITCTPLTRNNEYL